jgi:cytochrome oxidase assembly protein ShyY1
MIHCKTEARVNDGLALQQGGVAFIPLLLALLTVCASAAALWQWQRAQFHTELAQVTAQQQQAPINLNTDKDSGASQARVTGHWLQGSTVFVSPRIMDAQMGALAVSVLKYTDPQGQAHNIAVQRGWAPQTQPLQAPTVAPLSLSEVTLLGQRVDALARSFELKTMPLTTLGIWTNYDVAAHGAVLNIALDPRLLVLSDTSADADTLQLRRVPAQHAIATLTQKAASNRGYALQWLGLALVGVFGLAWMWRNRLKAKQTL